MAQVQNESASVRKGLADRMKPRTAEASASAAPAKPNYSSRFQNPGAGTNRSRTLDRSRFQNPNAGRPPQSQGYTGNTQPGGQVPGQYQTPGRPQQPQTAQPYYPPAPPQVPAPPPAPPQPVPPQVQTPGRPMYAQPQVPRVAQPYYPPQQYPRQQQYPQVAQPQWVNGQLQQSQPQAQPYNPYYRR